MVLGLLGDIARQLRHLHIARQILLQARKDHLALARLEAVRKVRDAPVNIGR